MASVHLARWVGSTGLSRIVAVKRLHPNLAADPEFSAMFLDEARIATRIRHVNVIPTLDVASQDGAVFIVMEYVPGESLATLQRVARKLGGRVPAQVAVAIASGVLRGLHAAHEACGEDGRPLQIVHRDVSPHNVLIGVDGIARLLDFGIAKALGQLHTTRTDQMKGKMGYIAPEQLKRGAVDRRTDVFTASIVLWETLVGERLFHADTDAETIYQILEKVVEHPAKRAGGVTPELDAAVMRGLERAPDARFATALEMAEAIERAVPPASAGQVGAWLATVAHERLAEREEIAREIGDVVFSPTLRERAARAPLAPPAAKKTSPRAIQPSREPDGPAVLAAQAMARSSPDEGAIAPSAEGETRTLRFGKLGLGHAEPARAPASPVASHGLGVERAVAATQPPAEDYGTPPRTLLGAAGYTLRVVSRRGAMAQALVDARAALAATQEGRRDVLVELVEALPENPEPGDPLAPWLVPLDRFRARPVDPSLQPFELQWAADVNDALASVVRRRQAAAAQLDEYTAQFQRIVDERERAEAKQKRADIERRAEETAARATGRPPATGTSAEAERKARGEALEGLNAEADSVQAAVTAAQSRLDAVELEVAELEEQRRRLEERGAQRLAEMRGFREEERRDAFVRAGEQVLDWCPNAVPEEARAALGSADAAIVAARARLEEVEQSHAGFDRTVYRRGVGVLGVLAGVLALAALGVAAVLFAN